MTYAREQDPKCSLAKSFVLMGDRKSNPNWLMQKRKYIGSHN